MKRITYIVLIAVITGCSGSKETTNLPEASIYDFDKTITVEGLKSDLTIIASDEFEGRETGEEGIRKATEYITERYNEMGLTPVGDNGTFEQNYDLSAPVINSYKYTVTDKDGSLISETAVTKEATGDFVTIFGGSDDVSGEIIFAGFGISNEETNHLPEVVADKWVMVFFDRQLTNQTALQRLIGNGAAGVILIMDHKNPEGVIQNAQQSQSRLGAGGRLSLSYLRDNDQITPAWNSVNPELAAKLLGQDSVSELVELSEEIKTNASGFKPIELEYALSHDVSVNENT
ncbi:MAG TPA: hypothetical protein DEO59_13580, partial [Balneola sp.]|nr:hypothetical protein [Balneola sp.]